MISGILTDPKTYLVETDDSPSGINGADQDYQLGGILKAAKAVIPVVAPIAKALIGRKRK